MIKGPGYLGIIVPNMPNVIAFTRSGIFQLEQDTRRIVTADGDPLMDIDGGEITIPDNVNPSQISIDSTTGVISYSTPNSTDITEIGAIVLYNFPNEKRLEAIGSSLLIETAASGEAEVVDPAVMHTELKQFYLETSNVSAIEELTEIISAQRAYELSSKIIKISDEMAQSVNKIK